MKSNQLLKMVVGVVTLAFTLAAFAAEDTAFVTSLQGRVMGVGKQVAAFTKLRAGETLTVNKDARIQVVYFENARQETWAGGTEFKIGADKSDALVGAPESVKSVSPILAAQLKKAPSGTGTTRVGMVRTRSVEAMALREAEGAYADLKKEDERAAQLYMLSKLNELGAWDRMEQFVSDMVAQNPSDSTVADLATMYKGIASAGRAASTAKN